MVRLGVLLGAVGCAGPGSPAGPRAAAPVVLPTRTSFDAADFASQPSSVVETVLTAAPERVWAALPAVFRTLGVEVTTLDERTRVIGNEQWRPSAIHGSRLSTFLQCGSGIAGANADTYEVTAQLLVQPEPAAPGSTLVRVVLDAYARPRTSAGSPIHCSSHGTLEARVRRLIDERLAAPAPGEGTAVVATGPGAAGTPAGGPRLFGYRLPEVGDVIRVGCASDPSAPLDTRAGTFRGAGDGALLLAAEGGARLSVPAGAVRSVEIRERRSRTRWGAVAGAVLGAAGGGWVGDSQYDPDSKTHYPRSAMRAIGAVLGGVAGALVGAGAGALIGHDAWVEVPPSWAVQVAGPPPGDGSAASCPTQAGGG